MKKFIIVLFLTALLIPITISETQASLISDRGYRYEQSRENKQSVRQIKDLFKVYEMFANRHDLDSLGNLYSDNYINNDGFNKKTYFKSIESTWEECKDITYTTKILSIDVNGDYARVNVEETATGTLYDTMEDTPVAGEVHSKTTGIYHLLKINNRWFISGETALTDESSLPYGDARFMNIEIQSPSQVSSGETYTTTVKVDADSNTFIIGSIDKDVVTYPSSTPKSELRAMPQTQVLERILKANTDNLNEYTIASLAISKAKSSKNGGLRVYMSGLACVMKRVNVVPVNNFIKSDDKKAEGKDENVNR